MGKIVREFWCCDICKAEYVDYSELNQCVVCNKDLCVNCEYEMTTLVTVKTAFEEKDEINETAIFCKGCLEGSVKESHEAMTELLLGNVPVNVQFSD